MGIIVYRVYDKNTLDVRKPFDVKTDVAYSLSNDTLQFVPGVLESDGFIKSRVRWDFGDNTYSEEYSPVKTYEHKGVYEVKMTLFDKNYKSSTFYTPIKVNNIVEDAISFDKTYGYFQGVSPEKALMSINESEISKPVKVKRQNSWQTLKYHNNGDSYSAILYPANSKSYYFNKKDAANIKMLHLIPTVKFLERNIDKFGNIEYTQIDNINFSNKLIYASKSMNFEFSLSNESSEGSVIAGSEGDAEFYFVDDTSTKDQRDDIDLRTVFITLNVNNFTHADEKKLSIDISNYNNQIPVKGTSLSLEIDYEVLKSKLDRIYITSNGVCDEGDYKTTFNINPTQWKNVPITFTALQGNASGSILRNEANIILKNDFNVDIHGDMLLSSNVIKVTPVKKVGDNWEHVNDSAVFELHTYDDLKQYSKDFIYGEAVINTSIYDDCVLSATLWRKREIDDLYPKFIFFTNPSRGVLYRYKKFYADNRPDIAIFGNVIIQNNTLSSNVGNFGVAYDAIRNRFWYTNPIENTVNVLNSNTGELINKFEIDILGANPCAIVVNRQGNAWVSLPDSLSSNAYLLDAENGNKLQIITDTSSNVFLSSTLYKYNDGFVGENTLQATDIDEFDGDVYILFSHYNNNFIYKINSNNLVNTSKENFIVTNENDVLAGDGIILDLDGNNQYTEPGYNNMGGNNGDIIVDSNDNALKFEDSIYDILDPMNVLNLKFYNDHDNYFTAIKLDNNGQYLIAAGRTMDRSSFHITLISAEEMFNIEKYEIGEPVGCMTFDKFNRLWISHGSNKISCFSIVNEALVRLVSFQLYKDINSYEQYITGLGTDEENLWIIDSNERKINAVSLDISMYDGVENSLQEPVTINYPASPNYFSVVNKDGELIGYGDWTGYNMIQKYYKPLLEGEQVINISTVDVLTGVSSVFKVEDLNDYDSLIKKGESFDYTGMLKKTTYQEHIRNNDVLFNEMFKNIYGNSDSTTDCYGKKVYEKIENFVSNNADIDFCNIKNVFSFAEQFGITLNEQDHAYPYKLLRIMDILSVKYSNLRPIINKFAEDFGSKYEKGENIGNKLDFSTSILIKGEPIVIYDKFAEKFFKQETSIEASDLIGLSSFALSSWNSGWNWNLVLPETLSSGPDVNKFYDFYEYKANTSNKFIKGFIDYELSDQMILSSYENWTKSDGYMEKLIQKDLIEGLGFEI